MSANAFATLLILLSAVLHAAVNAIVKKSDDGLLTRACMNAMAFLVSLPFLFFIPPPSPEVWRILLASMLIHGLYPFFLVSAYRAGDLSTMLPLARGTSPLGVALLALFFAGEKLRSLQFASIALICVGITLLAFERKVSTAGRGIAFAIGTGLIVAVYTVLDGIGLRRVSNPFVYILWLFMLDGLFVGLTVGWLRRARVWPFVSRYWSSSLWGGVLGISSYGLALYALSLTSMAAIAAMRETSMLFAAVIGALILKETFGWQRVTAAIIVVVGVVALKLTS